MDDNAAKIAELEAQLAALRAARQRIDVGADASVVGSPQTDVGGDMLDNALGSGNVVLHDITIEAGGTLAIGGPVPNLAPQPEALRRALAAYLRTLLESYQHLSLHGLGAGGSRQVRIGLRAVFVNLLTNVTIGEAQSLFVEDIRDPSRAQLRGPSGRSPSLSADLRQWLAELLTDDERAVLNPEEPQQRKKGAARRRPARSDEQLAAIKQRLLGPRTALELIRHCRALVLLGDPGSGKTTVLRHLALGFAHARLSATQADGATVDPELAWGGPLPLPILVQLRRFAEELAVIPADAGVLLGHVERTLSGNRLDALAGHLQDRLEAGEVLLLLDGLDEVADEERRAWVARAVDHFQTRFPDSRIVLTSRTYAYRDPCRLPPVFQVATLQLLEPGAQDEFIARWYRAALLRGSELAGDEQTAAAQRRAQDLVDGLERRPRLREIAANPLLLTMIALLHLNGLGLPQQRAELYQACLLLLLEQWEQRRTDGGPAGLAAALGVPDRLTTTGERLALIQPIAYQLQALGREEARQAEVRQWLIDRFLDLAGDDGKRAKALIEQFLGFLEGRSGLMIARDLKDRYAFPHKTFQEYLAARELIYLGAAETLRQVLEHRHAATWREVILLVVGHLVANSQPQQAKEIAWKLLDADPPGAPGFYRSAALAGEIVEELGDSLGRDGRRLRDDVVQALVELVQGGRLGAKERVEAAALLGRLGDPRLPTPDRQEYWCEIAPGQFWSGDDRKEQLKQVELPHGYRIGRYAVTNAEYKRFIDAGGYTEHRWWTKEGWKYLQPGSPRFSGEEERITVPRYWKDARYNGSTQPVVGISWYEAAAYCIWLTEQGHRQGWLPDDAAIRLPTWLEWERAARHTDTRRYPWGNDEPDAERANYQETSIGRPAPVGCFPNGMAVCTAHDLVANVCEWTATSYDGSEALVPHKDFTSTSGVVFAYNDFTDSGEQLCCGARDRYNPSTGIHLLGFRIVWSRALIE